MRWSGGGNKHQIFPGYDSNNLGRYSKGDTTWNLDYESGVSVDKRLEKIFEKIPQITAKTHPMGFSHYLREN